MSNRCTWPTCKDPEYKNGLCFQHNRSYGTADAKKPPKPLAKRSEKMKSNMKQLRELYPEFLAQPGNDKCKLNMKGCTKTAVTIHHSKGRVGELLFDQKYWMPSCLWCNIEVENKDAEAREKGLKISKFKNG